VSLFARRILTHDPVVEPDVLDILEQQEFEHGLHVGKGPLNDREKLLLSFHLRGYNCAEIAARLHEDKRIISVELNAVKSKVRYRLKRRNTRTKASKVPNKS
jgi:hypothetical protein